jgi:hypothetical protein
MRKYKLDERAEKAPESDDLSKYKDFGKVVTDYQKLAHDLHRKPLYKDKRLFLFVLIALLLLYLLFESQREQPQEKSPTPPESSQPLDPEASSLD